MHAENYQICQTNWALNSPLVPNYPFSPSIQLWIRENKAPMVRLSYVDGTDDCGFKQLVKKIRAHGVSLPSYLLPPLATLRF